MERKTTKTQTYNGRNQHGQNLVLEEANKAEEVLGEAERQRGRGRRREGGRKRERERKGYKGEY